MATKPVFQSTGEIILASINDEALKTAIKEKVAATGLPPELAYAALKADGDPEVEKILVENYKAMKKDQKNVDDARTEEEAAAIAALKEEYKTAIKNRNGRLMVTYKNMLYNGYGIHVTPEMVNE